MAERESRNPEEESPKKEKKEEKEGRKRGKQEKRGFRRQHREEEAGVRRRQERPREERKREAGKTSIDFLAQRTRDLHEVEQELSRLTDEQKRAADPRVVEDLERRARELSQRKSRIESDLQRGTAQVAAEAASRGQEALSLFTGVMQREQEIREAQIPEALRVPNLEKAKEELRRSGEFKDGDRDLTRETDPRYQMVIERWFEERLRHLESYEQTFEEHSWLLSPLELAVTRFQLNPETKVFGDKLRERLEVRRVRQRMVRIWNLGNPEAIWGESSRFTFPILKELFTYQTPDKVDADGKMVERGEKLVEREFQNYEKMGQKFLEAKLKSEKTEDRAEKERLTKEKNEAKKVIFNYFKHGGQIDGEFVDERITRLEREGGSKKEIDELKELLWSRRFTGGLWSMTLRAAYFDVELNGSGDFFAARLLNFVDRLQQDALSMKTKEIWDPKDGESFDLEYRDYWTNLLSGAATIKEGVDEGKIDWDFLKDFGFDINERKDTRVVLDKDPAKDKKAIKFVRALATARIGDKDFWNRLERDKGVAPNNFTLHMYGFNVADATRKALLGAGNFFHNPELGNFLKLVGVFEHVSPRKEVIELAGGKREEVSSRQRKWQEFLERVLVWGRTKEAGEVVEMWEIFGDAEGMAWIEQADDEEMITKKQREFLFRKYLNVPLLSSLSSRTGAETRALISVVLGPFKYGPMRAVILWGTFGEFFKRALKYIFS